MSTGSKVLLAIVLLALVGALVWLFGSYGGASLRGGISGGGEVPGNECAALCQESCMDFSGAEADQCLGQCQSLCGRY